MIRFLLLAALFYIAIQILRFLGNVRKYSQSAREVPRLTGVMVKDEMCHTYLPEEEAIKEKIEGKIYYFCSPECRRRFLEERKRERVNQRTS